MTEPHPLLHVIVGATSPIARAYAVDCAIAGKPLLLAGRDLAELELIAADLKIRHAVSVAVERYDASLPGEGRRLALTFAGRPVGAVVAFHGIMGDRDDFAAMLQVNCASIAELFEAVADQYDFVLIDCPPSLSMLTLNGLCCAHGVIVPMQCEYFALEGLTDLVNTSKQVHANLNKELAIIGLLRVMFDPRITLQQQVSEQLKNHFGDKVFNTLIPRNVRLAEAPSYGMPGVVFDPAAKGSQAFVEFARELVERAPKL